MQNLFYKKSFVGLFFSTILFIIFLREPCWLIEGSLKPDELSYYLNGKSKSFFENLFFVYPGTGALMFWSNITNSIISLFPINQAKILANYLTLLVYLFIFIYIYFTKSVLFTNHKHKIFAIFIVLLSPPMTPEIWMSSAHLRGYFGILSFVLLFQDFKNDKIIINKITNFLVFFSGICSIYAAALTPAYLLKFYLNKDKNDLNRFIFASLAFCIQFFVVVYFILTNISNTPRFNFEISTFYSYFYNIPIRSFFGSTIPKIIFVETEIFMMQYFDLFIYVLFISVLILALSYIIKKKDQITYLIIFSLILISSLVILGTVQPGFVGGRYAVVPGVLMIFLVFRFFIIEKNSFFKNIFFLLLILCFVVGGVEYRFLSPLPQSLQCIDYNLQVK